MSMHSISEILPYQKNNHIAFPFENEIQINIKEKETFKSLKNQFENLNVDFTKLFPTTHAPFKGRLFILATQVYHLKAKKRYEEWFNGHIGEIFKEGHEEFDQDIKVLKLALRTILNSHLINLPSTQLNSRALTRKIEEQIINLNPHTEAERIDFVSILRLLQNDDSSPDSSPRSSTTGLYNTHPRDSQSKTLHKRQLSRNAKHIKDKHSHSPEPTFCEREPGIERRAYSSPTLGQTVKKIKENAQEPNLSMSVIYEMLEGQGYTIVLNNGCYQIVEGQLTHDVLQNILYTIELAVTQNQKNEDILVLKEVLNSLYSYTKVTDLFQSHVELYKIFLKLIIGIEFCYWALNWKKFDTLLKQYRNLLVSYEIPTSFEVVCNKEKEYLWKLIDKKEMHLYHSIITMLADPFNGFQQLFSEYGQIVRKTVLTLKDHYRPQITELRQLFEDASKKHMDDLDFLAFIGCDEACSSQLKQKSEGKSTLAQINRVVLSLGCTMQRMDQMQPQLEFPPYLYLRDLFEPRILQLQHFYFMLAISIKNFIEYLANKEEMHSFFESINDGVTTREKLRELLKNPLANFEAILSCFEN